MSGYAPDQREALRQQIDASFQKATDQQARLKGTDRRFSTAQTLLGGLSTLVAGFAAATGKPPGDDWRLTCAAAAVLAFGATTSTVAHRQRSDPELLAHTSECVGKLRSLRVAAIGEEMETGELSNRYRQVLMEYDRVAV